MECHGRHGVPWKRRECQGKLNAQQEEQADAHLKASDDVERRRGRARASERQPSCRARDDDEYWTTSGKVLAGIDSFSHDSETVRARLETALRRREPGCGLS